MIASNSLRQIVSRNFARSLSSRPWCDCTTAVGGGRFTNVAGRRLLSTATAAVEEAPTTTKVASVLQLTNVQSLDTVTKLDTKMKAMTTLMREHAGFEYTTRYVSDNSNNNREKEGVCNDSYEYELSFIFDSSPSLETWKTSTTRDIVHAYYLEALEDCGIEEANVKGGTRLVDTW